MRDEPAVKSVAQCLPILAEQEDLLDPGIGLIRTHGAKSWRDLLPIKRLDGVGEHHVGAAIEQTNKRRLVVGQDR
jgi:hypothetical protein